MSTPEFTPADFFDTKDTCIKITSSNSAMGKDEKEKHFVIYTEEYDNLVGLEFVSLSFVEQHLCNRKWFGELKNGDSIIVVFSLNVVCIGIGESEIKAKSNLKPVAALNNIFTDIYELGKILHWKVPFCVTDFADYV